ncbi:MULTISPECIES: glycosyltransferase family 4 protein [unclassified Oceanispirochaeta]|uniref:glycosyltransferase family 4 protein n=1 Tax=unclassified Oceanispirochaeta TaxID=2635722 RepID=UPI000E0925B9|nr:MULTISPECIES: glycosyltransferase family 4 protein [unclassified Oceanispirochaeta]MBF9016746.1 glycosyltransferase family 4 protein [Oceanispirochaeta sp. M2]NPD72016.1 glycosyltransferase [Oceanispirochaeta sp. M1]RDG32460.1 glycosyltransferase [Oceanispirochaeta sp. M1]
MKIACIGNYPPRECGIATFTKDFIQSLLDNNAEGSENIEAYVIAMNDQDQEYEYQDIVAKTINQNIPKDYIKAVEFINFSNADVCVLQHEFGIYGGNSGVYILPLIHRLTIPLIVIFHTVLKNPSYNERNIIVEIGKKASKIVVMNSLAIEILEEGYGISKDKIAVIPHGVPVYDFTHNQEEKERFNVLGRKTLITFGLLSRNKGLETVIKALPEVVKKHPDLLYIVLGKTHPAVVRHSGEEYRNYLKLLVNELGLLDNVYFDDRFVDTDELLGYLAATDLYVTPYLNEAQITSGTLSYAVGAGAAVISTPYWHAKELLTKDRGILFDFNDSKGLAKILIDLLDNPEKLQSYRNNAFEYGKKTSWPEIGRQYLVQADEARKSYIEDHHEKEWVIKPLLLPQFSMDHVSRMTDTSGILQHAKYNIPKWNDGYCVDDNSRALLMASMAYQQFKDPEVLRLMSYYLSFIQYMQNDDGTIRNFLGYDRQYLDEKGSEDSFGRTIWALGFLVRSLPSDSYSELARELFLNSYSQFDALSSLRGIANTILGVCHWLHRYPGDEGMLRTLKLLTSKILPRYGDHNKGDWHWFEQSLSYDNGIIPYALLHSYEITSDVETLSIALESLQFLENVVFKESSLSLVGSENWYTNGEECSDFDQQPLDAMSIVLMFHQAYMVTRDKRHLQKMFDSFLWFLGENDLRIPLYDFETKGCNDGLKIHGVNRNQGAESTLAYLISHLTVMSCYEISV